MVLVLPVKRAARPASHPAATCLDESAILALTQGRLRGAAFTAAEEHLDACAACRRAAAIVLRPEPPAPAAPRIARGTAIGRYLVIERIGAGAMGQVFSAYDPELDRRIALKLLRPGAATPEHRARLAREAQTLARLSHPNVVTVFDVGTWQEQLFVALELVAGGSFRAWAAEQRPDRARIVQLFIAAGRGLAAAHAAGVVHRDFKPDNLLVASDGRPQVTDFGLAAAAPGPRSSPAAPPGPDDPEALGTITETDALLGTPAYMAPDQLDGEPASPASDQFAFCVSLAEALCGHRPFEAATIAALRQKMLDGSPDLSAKIPLPAALEAVLRRGLSPHADRRYPSLDALVEALERTQRPGRARLFWTVAGLGILVAIAGAVALPRLLGPRRHPACELVADRQKARWSEAPRSAVQKAFLATGQPFAANAFALIAPQLDARAAAFRTQRSEACEALMRATPATSPLWTARVACLDERWAELEATLDLLAAGGDKTVARAAAIVDRLAPASTCQKGESLVRYGVDGAVVRARLVARARAAESGALYEAGRFAEAAALAGRPPTEGGAPDDPLVRGVLLFEHARATAEGGALDDAEREFTEAGRAGLAGRDPQLAAAAWLELGYLIGTLRGRPEPGAVWLEAAEGMLASMPGERAGPLTERLASVHGVIEARRGRHAAAEQYFLRVEALVRERLGERHPARARALTNCANAALHQGHIPEALAKLEAAYSLIERAYGPEHPEAFQVQNSWGAALGEAGRFGEAAAIFARVLAGYKKTLGPRHPRLGTAAQNLAEAYRRADRLDEAAAAYADAVSLWESALGPDAPDLAHSLAGLSETRFHLGRLDEAAVAVRRALAICARQSCEPMNEASMHIIAAEVLEKQHARPAEIRAALQRAIAIYHRIGEAAAEERAAAERSLRGLRRGRLD